MVWVSHVPAERLEVLQRVILHDGNDPVQACFQDRVIFLVNPLLWGRLVTVVFTGLDGSRFGMY